MVDIDFRPSSGMGIPLYYQNIPDWENKTKQRTINETLMSGFHYFSSVVHVRSWDIGSVKMEFKPDIAEIVHDCCTIRLVSILMTKLTLVYPLAQKIMYIVKHFNRNISFTTSIVCNNARNTRSTKGKVDMWLKKYL